MEEKTQAIALRATEGHVLDQARALVLAVRESDLDDQRPVAAVTEYLREVVYPLIEQVHASLDPVVNAAHTSHKEAIRARRDLLEPLDHMVFLCKQTLAEREKFLRQREESARVQIDVEAIPEAGPQTVSLQTKGLQVSLGFDFSIVNVGLIQRGYLAPDLVAIRKAVRKHGKHAEVVVGGIVVTEELPKITVRR